MSKDDLANVAEVDAPAPPYRPRLNLGCGPRPLEGYINVDLDTPEAIRARYPDQDVPGLPIYSFDIFNLPFPDESVAEVRADSLIEHLSFREEPRFFREVHRVLCAGGLIDLSTPDFEDAVRLWLEAEDDWKEFYRNDPEAVAKHHWFGQYSYSTRNRWGYLMAMIFGNQNGPGQFHKNAYTESKLRAVMEHLGFKIVQLTRFRWKGDRDLMLRVQARKSA